MRDLEIATKFLGMKIECGNAGSSESVSYSATLWAAWNEEPQLYLRPTERIGQSFLKFRKWRRCRSHGVLFQNGERINVCGLCHQTGYCMRSQSITTIFWNHHQQYAYCKESSINFWGTSTIGIRYCVPVDVVGEKGMYSRLWELWDLYIYI